MHASATMTALRQGPPDLLQNFENHAELIDLPRIGTDDNFAYPNMQLNISPAASLFYFQLLLANGESRRCPFNIYQYFWWWTYRCRRPRGDFHLHGSIFTLILELWPRLLFSSGYYGMRATRSWSADQFFRTELSWRIGGSLFERDTKVLRISYNSHWVSGPWSYWRHKCSTICCLAWISAASKGATFLTRMDTKCVNNI